MKINTPGESQFSQIGNWSKKVLSWTKKNCFRYRLTIVKSETGLAWPSLPQSGANSLAQPSLVLGKLAQHMQNMTILAKPIKTKLNSTQTFLT